MNWPFAVFCGGTVNDWQWKGEKWVSARWETKQNVFTRQIYLDIRLARNFHTLVSMLHTLVPMLPPLLLFPYLFCIGYLLLYESYKRRYPYIYYDLSWSFGCKSKCKSICIELFSWDKLQQIIDANKQKWIYWLLCNLASVQFQKICPCHQKNPIGSPIQFELFHGLTKLAIPI